MKPHRTVPWDDEQEADCAALVLWCFGLSRFQNPIWIDCTRLVAIARAHEPANRLFTSVEWLDCLPGDAVAWPDRIGENDKYHEGHCGIVTEVGNGGPIRVVHCSSSNFKQFSDAIAETDATIFAANRAVIVRCADLTSPVEKT